jgi:integrase
VRDRLSFLNIYWKWLVYQDLARDDAVNPFTGVDLPKGNRKEADEKKRRPFTVADIRKIHSAIMATGNETLQAAFMIAIYTGCRVEEITSLRCEDVAADTITVRQAKTTAGNREVPIHDALKPLMRRLKAQGSDFILPNLKADIHGKRSQGIRRRFRPVLDRLGFDERYVFHSLRYTVTTLLEQADVPEGISVDILGHGAKKGITYGLYSAGTSFDQKRRAIMKLDC